MTEQSTKGNEAGDGLTEQAAAEALEAAGSRPAGESGGPDEVREPGGGEGESGGGDQGAGPSPAWEPDIRTHFPIPHVCRGCGAVADREGNPLDNTCQCAEGPDWDPLERVELVSTVDPTTGHPNIYAQRVKARLAADAHYLLAQARDGHGKAATETCEKYGHDGRAGFCMRCGGRLGRAHETFVPEP